MNFSKYNRKRKVAKLDSHFTKILNLISSTFGKLLVYGFVLAIVISVGAGFGALKAITDSAPNIDNLVDVVQPKGYTSIVYDLDGNEIQRLAVAEANRIYVDYDQMPTYLGDAYVAIEDERFYDHNGMDFEAMLRAVVVNLQAGKIVEGASTITQQLVTSNILDKSDVSFARKFDEIVLALELEQQVDKSKILELYMNTVPTGLGRNGVQTASKLYFNKDVSEVSIAESAVLAAIANNPIMFEPLNHPEANRERAIRILSKMYEQEMITATQYEEAMAEDVYSNIRVITQDLSASSQYSYFIDETIRQVAEDLSIEKGILESQAYNLIYSGGLSIYITQDLDMQNQMDSVFLNEENFPSENEEYAIKLMYSLSILTNEGSKNLYFEEQFKNQEKANEFIANLKAEYNLTEDDFKNKKAYESARFIPQPQAAMVIMDYHTGHIKAMTGGRGEKIGNQTFNRATQAYRQPGSTFKILAAYLPAIDTRGYTLGDVLDDVPYNVTLPNGETYSPKNYYKGFKGLQTIREGIVDSINILALKTQFDIGYDISYDYLMDLGFSEIYDNKVIGGKTFTDKTLSLPLGGLTKGVTPLELTAAYGAIANQGTYVAPIFYTRVLDNDGAILLSNETESKPVMKETTSFLLTDAMVDVVKYGTGKLAKFKESDMPVAGKTGTTNNSKDIWFAGYTPYYVGAIWMGYDDPQKMDNHKNAHKKIWAKIMEPIHEPLPVIDFKKPENITRVAICTKSGKRPVPGLCDKDPRGSTIRYEYFVKGTEPTEFCDVHKEVLICNESGLFATEFCPPETVHTEVRIQRPEPIIPENFDPDEPMPKIFDLEYDIPYNMVGEYCHIHGPHTETEDTTIPTEETDVISDTESNNTIAPIENTTPSTTEVHTDTTTDTE